MRCSGIAGPIIGGPGILGRRARRDPGGDHGRSLLRGRGSGEEGTDARARAVRHYGGILGRTREGENGPRGEKKREVGRAENWIWAGFQFHCFSYFHFFSNSNHSNYLNSNSNLNSTLAIKQK